MAKAIGRPTKPVDPASGPVAAFAAELRELCASAAAAETPPRSTLDLRELERRTRAIGQYRSRGTLSDALSGRRPPTWKTTKALVEALQGDVADWERRFRMIEGNSAPGASEQPSPSTAVLPAPEPQRRKLGRRGYGILALLCLVAVVGAIWFLPVRETGERSPTVTVQNKVAIGVTQLLEDSTPSYLSTRPVARCASLGCKIAGSEMWSGIKLPAICQTEGQKMSNADEGSAGIAENPGAVRSSRWYGIHRTDGTVGLIAEVYLQEQDRGGLGLPNCSEFAGQISTVAPTPANTGAQ